MPTVYKSVPAIKKGFAILDLISKAEKPLGISDIAGRLKLSKSTVFNIVYTLLELKVLDDLNGFKFEFGPHLYLLGNASGKRSELIRIVHPYLTQINKKTRLTVFLGIRSDLKSVLIDKVDSTYVINISSEIGMQMPDLGGVGIKAMLSLLSRDEVDRIIGKAALKKYTPHSIVVKAEYLEEIDRVRNEGIAYDREEYIEGITAVGVPIKHHNLQIQAGIWVIGLKRQLSTDILPDVETLLKEIAVEINQRLAK